ncbi:MAG: Maf family protein [Thermodesulfobacteriota bacterium]
MFNTVEPLILASSSPRRRRFLGDLGLDFTIKPAMVSEKAGPGESPEEFVKRLARKKGTVVGREYPGVWVLSADTAVVLDGKILGKPESEDEAVDMLSSLAGRCHEVWTGYGIFRFKDHQEYVNAVMTKVYLCKLTKMLCRTYVRGGKSMDKAGAYGIQGGGAFLVSRIEGSYTNVVGLPLAEVIENLLSYGVIR